MFTNEVCQGCGRAPRGVTHVCPPLETFSTVPVRLDTVYDVPHCRTCRCFEAASKVDSTKGES